MLGWVGWSGMLEGKEGSLYAGLCVEIKDVYVSVLMKCVYSFGARCPPDSAETGEEKHQGERKQNDNEDQKQEKKSTL